MINILVQYLIKNGHLELPGVGILKCVKQESFWQNNEFIAPKEYIEFEHVDAIASKHFYIFLAESLNISIEQATLKLEQFLTDFKSQINGKITFNNLGVLTINNQILNWENKFNTGVYFKNIALTVAEKNNQINNDTRSRKDKWWIWAIVFFTISTSLILYKFYSI
jgi:hypothetical protein